MQANSSPHSVLSEDSHGEVPSHRVSERTYTFLRRDLPWLLTLGIIVLFMSLFGLAALDVVR